MNLNYYFFYSGKFSCKFQKTWRRIIWASAFKLVFSSFYDLILVFKSASHSGIFHFLTDAKQCLTRELYICDFGLPMIAICVRSMSFVQEVKITDKVTSVNRAYITCDFHSP